MNRKLTAVLLIVAAVLTNLAFTALGSVFNYPDILKEPTDVILTAFVANETKVVGWFVVLTLSAALFAPIAIGVGRLAAGRAMRLAVPVGIGAAVVQVVGLSRWFVLVPGYAADGDRDSFETAHHVLGTLIGETLGYALTAAWTLLVLAALGRRFVVPGPGRGLGGADRHRGGVAAGCAGGRLPQLHRVRAVERLAGRLRGAPGVDAQAGRGAGMSHVIFGTGAVGLATMEALRRRGEQVTMVNRSGAAPVPAGVKIVGGNAADQAFTARVARGAAVVHQTLNPPYDRWVQEFPALQAGVLAAAVANDARLVSMENVYMYGRANGLPLTEDRAYDAHTRKGRLRGEMSRALLAEMKYLFEEPFVVKSDKIHEKLGVRATPAEEALTATLAGHR
ncbi:hypothetical protein BJ973_002863 [Actinoplanes tereljensis]|uniref:Uncharacterized protein n=1 Tax=Paractinoplanes tereljensis TaxID=571912 RepID=A0A919NP85_9ACTN|nr:DUF4386 family protein [Actinoplanes tereljensis]GIF22539.1 hypothetical protein Ate02nite_52690 [Actinoplanes tereljensis]